MPESDRPTSNSSSDRTSLDPHELLDPTVPAANEQWPSDPMPMLEHDLEVLSWLVCSPQLGGEVTGYLCDALAAWALAGRGYPQMALPDAGPECDHLQALEVIIDRIPQRIIDADGVALKMDLGRFGRLLTRAFWASWDPESVRDSVQRELVAATPWVSEGLRHVFAIDGDEGKDALDQALIWVRRCQIPPFIDLARKITKHHETIDAALEHNLSNALVESTNTKIRLLTRIAFGFKSPEPLIALAMLSLGGYRPSLPGGTAHG